MAYRTFDAVAAAVEADDAFYQEFPAWMGPAEPSGVSWGDR